MFKITFRKFDYRKDVEDLFTYMTEEKNQILFSHGFQVHNIPMFEHWISEKFSKSEYHDFFMIEDSRGNTIGFTFSYEFFNFDAHCKYTLCLYNTFQNIGYGYAAGAKMVDYLFRNYPLKRIFISVFDYNKNSLLINKKAGFEEVANLPDYRFYDGNFHSLHILTLTREKFYKAHQKVLSSI